MQKILINAQGNVKRKSTSHGKSETQGEEEWQSETNFQNPNSIHFLTIFYILTFDIFLFIRMEMVVIDDMGVKAFEKFLPMSRVNINPEIKLAECVRLAKDKDGNLVTIIL